MSRCRLLGHRNDVDDEARRLRAVDQPVSVLGIRALGQMRFPGDRGIDAAGRECDAGIGRGHVHRLDVVLRKSGIQKERVDEELRNRAFLEGDGSALEIGDGGDVLVGGHPVAAVRVVDREDVSHRRVRFHVDREFICRGGHQIDLSGHQSAHLERRVLHDAQLDVDTFLGEETFFSRNVEGTVPYPGRVTQDQGLGGGGWSSGEGHGAEHRGGKLVCVVDYSVSRTLLLSGPASAALAASMASPMVSTRERAPACGSEPETRDFETLSAVRNPAR